jgi:hypothetical protein
LGIEPRLREEALQMLEGRGLILETARHLSRLLQDEELPAVVIGGVSVVLHGHVRTTVDVDILAEPPLERLVEVLTRSGYTFDPQRKEFSREGVPVHLVGPDLAGPVPQRPVEIEGIATVSLPRLLNMKLRTGTANVLRAQDLADVIGLIRQHSLGGDFVRLIDRDLRPEFRRLVRAIEQERGAP